MKFSCSACGTSLKVRDELAGKAVKCPKCGARNTVPAPGEEPQEEVAGGGGGGGGGENPLAVLAAMTGGATAAKSAAERGVPRAKAAAASVPPTETEQEQREEEESTEETEQSVADLSRSVPANVHSGAGVGAVAYRGGEAGPPGAPRYQVVRMVGVIQQVLGYIIVGVGGLWLGFGVVMAVLTLVKTKEATFAIVGLTANGVIGLYLLILGIFLVGAGQLLFCVRDMARNSFYLKRLGANG